MNPGVWTTGVSGLERHFFKAKVFSKNTPNGREP